MQIKVVKCINLVVSCLGKTRHQLMEAQFVVQENARKHQGLFPLAAETVLKSIYMDDPLDSAENDNQGIRMYHELKDLWAKANMQARK